MSLSVFLKPCPAELLCHSPTTERSPSDSTVFLAQQILIRRVDLHGFLCNPIYKPTEKKKGFQSRSTSCSSALASQGSCGALVMGPSSRLVSPLPLALPWGVPVRGAHASGSPFVSESKKMCSQDLGGTWLCISCDVSVTKSGEKFRLPNVFQDTRVSFLLVLLSLLSPPPREHGLKTVSIPKALRWELLPRCLQLSW